MPEDMAYDDGLRVEITCEASDEDERGDADVALADLTAQEMGAGEFLGVAIDPDDDEDDGSQWGTLENPTMTREDFEALS